MRFHVNGSGPETWDVDADEASPCSSQRARKPRPQLILYPSYKQALTSRVPSSCTSRLFSPQPLIVFSDFRLPSSFAAVLLLSLLRRTPPPPQPPILLWPIALRATQIKKNKTTQFVFGTTSAMVVEGEERALLESPFEDGLKSVPVDLAVRGRLFSLVDFVLQDKKFDLEATLRRCTLAQRLILGAPTSWT